MTTSGKSSAEHAVLSPSASERWIACPASVRLSKKMPPGAESKYALEGTAAHALGELEARLAFQMITAAEATRERNTWRKHWQKRIGLTEVQEEEMAVHVAAYVALIRERMQRYPGSILLLEQRMPTGVPSCWGTSDTVIVSPQHVEIIDLKYGAGIRVAVSKNSQLRFYAIGALESIADLLGTPTEVFYTVFQPRLDHTETETISPDDLRAWRDALIPVAELALGDSAPFNPSDEACRWCPAAGQCRAQLQWATQRDFGGDPDLLSNDDIAAALLDIPGIQQWCDAVKTLALDKAYSQEENIPGFKVVRSTGRRTIPDGEAAIEVLLETGHPLAEVSARKLKGIGELERLLGKEDFARLLDPFIVMTTGTPSLVPETDKRPAINPNLEASKEEWNL